MPTTTAAAGSGRRADKRALRFTFYDQDFQAGFASRRDKKSGCSLTRIY
jgi:hypothetical protein